MNDSDSEILLPWSPVNLSARQNIKTPEEDNHSSESNDSPISPIGYSRQQLKLSPSSTSANLVSADTSKIEDTPPLHFSDGHLPWSPPSIKIMQPPVKQIAKTTGLMEIIICRVTWLCYPAKKSQNAAFTCLCSYTLSTHSDIC